MAFMRLTMDGTVYRVKIVYDTLVRAFSLIEGTNADDMLSGRYERDLIGTKFDYQMGIEPDARYQSDYDAFFDAISDPKNSHTITVPYGQGNLTYEAMVTGGSDTFAGTLSGEKRWHGLVVTFKAISVQKEPA